MNSRKRRVWLVAPVLMVVAGSWIWAQHGDRPTPPTRDPHTPGYVKATELPDGAVPPADADGNFIIGPTHNISPDVAADGKIVNGTVFEFTMNSGDSKFYPGITR